MLSQNTKSRIPIRVSKFSTLSCTPMGAFNFTKKSCFDYTFSGSGKMYHFLETVNDTNVHNSTFGGPQNGNIGKS